MSEQQRGLDSNGGVVGDGVGVAGGAGTGCGGSGESGESGGVSGGFRHAHIDSFYSCFSFHFWVGGLVVGVSGAGCFVVVRESSQLPPCNI